MARPLSPDRLAELELLLSFLGALTAFWEERTPWFRSANAAPDGTSEMPMRIAWLREQAVTRKIPFSQVLTGVRQSVADLLAMTRDLSAEEVRTADARLAAAGAIPLAEMRRRVWRIVPKVLARERIHDVDEYDVVKNALDGGDDLVPADRARLETYRFEFEQRAGRRRRPSKR